MKFFVRGALALATMAVAAPAIAEAQAKPVIAVLYFENNSYGANRAEYDGLGKGIADMLITDLAQNPNIVVVERERIQALLVEQNLTKEKTIDPQTAVRLGKIIGAQHMITGGFISDSRGTMVLTARSINVETSAIANPIRLTSRGDDVLGFIAQLSQKVATDMKLPSLRVGQADVGATPAGQPAGQPAAPQHAQARADSAKPAAVKAETKAPAPAQQVAQSKPARKMDMKTAILYAKALEEEDAGNRSKAVELYRQVVDKFPEYAPAQQKIKKLSQS